MPRIIRQETDRGDVHRRVYEFDQTTPGFRRRLKDWVKQRFASQILQVFWRYASNTLVVVFKRLELAFAIVAFEEELPRRALFR